jgi:hypothetical protein
MRMLSNFDVVPHNVKVLVLLGLFLISTLITYFLSEDTALIEKRISSKQKDLALVLQLRDSYETKKRVADKGVVRRADQPALSLGTLEDMVSKSFVGGHLAQLQPVASKEGKGDRRVAVDVKVTGAPLGEVISFVRAAEDAGFIVRRLRLSLPAANPMALDMQATVMERRSRG